MPVTNRRRIRPRSIGALAIAALAVAALSFPALGARTTVTYSLSKTVKLKTIRLDKGPQEIRVLNLRAGAVPDLQPADGHFPLRKRTSAMSAAAHALAGINGDFGTNDGRPVHVLMIDGELWTTGLKPGTAVAWSEDGSRAYVGAPDLHIKTLGNAGTLFKISAWNAPQPNKAVGAYTSRGGTVVTPPGVASPTSGDPTWCEARLTPTTGLAWSNSARTAIMRRYTVAEQPDACAKTPLAVGSTSGAVVVAQRLVSGTTNTVKALSVGQAVRVTWTLRGWPGATDVMGGGDLLVTDGVNVAPGYHAGAPHILDTNPRTAIGITAGCPDSDPLTICEMQWVTVDGRQATSNWSLGVRLPFLANELIKYGSWDAVNLDGGGSTTMWVRDTNAAYCEIYPVVGGCLVNRPASTAPGNERPIRQAAVVLPTADPGTPAGLG
jgi:Phosphodiester glycosidase